MLDGRLVAVGDGGGPIGWVRIPEVLRWVMMKFILTSYQFHAYRPTVGELYTIVVNPTASVIVFVFNVNYSFL